MLGIRQLFVQFAYSVGVVANVRKRTVTMIIQRGTLLKKNCTKIYAIHTFEYKCCSERKKKDCLECKSCQTMRLPFLPSSKSYFNITEEWKLKLGTYNKICETYRKKENHISLLLFNKLYYILFQFSNRMWIWHMFYFTKHLCYSLNF